MGSEMCIRDRYSFIYNGSYMLPELLITTVCAVILCKAAPKFFLPEN